MCTAVRRISRFYKDAKAGSTSLCAKWPYSPHAQLSTYLGLTTQSYFVPVTMMQLYIDKHKFIWYKVCIQEGVIMMSINDTRLWVQAYQWIKDGINDGCLKVDEPLSENRLSREISISRTPIREALRVLEQEGYVKLLPAKGAFVSGISLEDVKEIYDIRKLLEPFAALSATHRVPDEEIQSMELGWLTLKERAEQNGTIIWSEIASVDKDFHFTLIKYSTNKRIRQTLTSCHTQIERFQFLSAESFSDVYTTIQQHMDLLETLKTRNAYRLSEELCTHIMRGEKQIMSTYLG